MYVLCSMAIVAVISAWHGIVADMIVRSSRDIARTADQYFCLAMGIIYVLFHIIVIFTIMCGVSL